MTKNMDDFIGIQMRRIEQDGGMDNNPFKGKPLDLHSYFKSPKETRAVYRVLSDSGFKPPVLQLLSDIRELEEEYKNSPSDQLKQSIIQLRLKYDIMR